MSVNSTRYAISSINGDVELTRVLSLTSIVLRYARAPDIDPCKGLLLSINFCSSKNARFQSASNPRQRLTVPQPFGGCCKRTAIFVDGIIAPSQYAVFNSGFAIAL
ncbi:hypothetical protein TNCV_1883031 [Trichonephila clavipes]|nr:hypothetical protein TNCV_1883031 [Trichonephila clavipes]